MEKTKMLKKVQLNTCPNPKCQRTFENLIDVHDKSKTPTLNYYACPYCLFKLDPIAKNTSTTIEKIEVQRSGSLDSEQEIIVNCPQHFGYLADHFSDSIIMSQCLECKRMFDCIKNVTDKRS
jgi:DNA-directed RNA polymerase subunit RPC12/RpoP